MGRIFDRTREHLGAADSVIIQMRRRLIKAARDLEKGIEPPGLDAADFRVRSSSIVLPRDTASWPEAAAPAIRAEPGAASSQSPAHPVRGLNRSAEGADPLGIGMTNGSATPRSSWPRRPR